jgi:hypothetical protein
VSGPRYRPAIGQDDHHGLAESDVDKTNSRRRARGTRRRCLARSRGYWPAHARNYAAVVTRYAGATCKRHYYKNVSGTCVHSPTSNSIGATAKCRDETYSYSQHVSGTCSRHGGVARWILHP